MKYMGQTILRQYPAVHIKDIVSGNGVDVGDIGFFFCRLKGTSLGLIKWIRSSENVMKSVQQDYEMRCRLECVFPQAGSACMALFADCFEAKP